MINFTPYEQRIIIAILIAIMEADGIIDPNETTFLDNIINEFGMLQKELDILSEFDLNLVIQDFRKFEKEKKEAAVKLFIDMAKCDGFAHPKELEIINTLGN